jgi:hypothetical protein
MIRQSAGSRLKQAQYRHLLSCHVLLSFGEVTREEVHLFLAPPSDEFRWLSLVSARPAEIQDIMSVLTPPPDGVLDDSVIGPMLEIGLLRRPINMQA